MPSWPTLHRIVGICRCEGVFISPRTLVTSAVPASSCLVLIHYLRQSEYQYHFLTRLGAPYDSIRFLVPSAFRNAHRTLHSEKPGWLVESPGSEYRVGVLSVFDC